MFETSPFSCFIDYIVQHACQPHSTSLHQKIADMFEAIRVVLRPVFACAPDAENKRQVEAFKPPLRQVYF